MRDGVCTGCKVIQTVLIVCVLCAGGRGASSQVDGEKERRDLEMHLGRRLSV